MTGADVLPAALIDAGWKPHDGTCCPVPVDSCPAIMTRSGDVHDFPKRPASYWSLRNDWWRWEGESRTNIVFFRPEVAA